MTTLVTILTQQTESLRVLFIEESAKHAERQYKIMLERKEWFIRDWCKYLGVEPTETSTGRTCVTIGYPTGFFNTSKAVELDKAQKQVERITRQSLQQFIQQSKADAQKHYENSILKLADRLSTKQLNVDAIVATTSHIGVNIETVLTDGVKSVRAFTILACGEINAPHYRYLIK